MARGLSQENRNWAVLGVELGTPDGPLRGQVRIDTGPMSLAEMVPSALELTSVLAGRANQKSARLGKPVSCCKGCGACCRQLVPLSIPEVFYLMDRVDGQDPIRRAATISRFTAIDSALDGRGMVEPLLDMRVGGDPFRSLNQAYFEMQMACPFLIDESCSIHPERPVACREYSVTSDRRLCDNPFAAGIDKVPMPLPLSASLSWLTSELLGEPPILVPLPLAPRFAAEHEEWREQRWPGLEIFQHFMRIAGGPPPDWAMNTPNDPPPAGISPVASAPPAPPSEA